MHPLRRSAPFFLVFAITSSSPVAAFAAPDAACLSAHRSSQQRRDEKKLVEARALLIECSADRCPGIVRGDCVEWLKQVEAALPSVVFRAVADSGEEPIPDDGLEVVAPSGTYRLDGRAVPMDPGAHALRLTRAGTTIATLSVTILEGKKHQTVTFRVPPDPKPTPSVPPATALAMPVALPIGERTPSALPWVLVAAGAVTLAAGATLSGTTWLALDDCHHNRNCTSSDATSIKTRLAIGDVAMGVGVVAAAVGLVMIVTRAGQTR